MPLKVVFVSRDAAVRMAGARAFERAPADWVIELAEHAPADADVVVCGPDVTDCSGLAFDPDRPASIVDAVLSARNQGGVIAVAGACGGCGVTTIALHLARTFGSCVIERAQRAGLAERLGLDRAGLKTWGPDAGDLALAALPMADGYRALFAPAGEHPPVDDVVSAARSQFGTVVLDVPSGCDVPADRETQVVVMPATAPGARRARVFMEATEAVGTRALVANHLGPGGETTRALLQNIAGDRITLELSSCPALRDAEDDGILLPARHRWCRRLDALGAGLRSGHSEGGRPS